MTSNVRSPTTWSLGKQVSAYLALAAMVTKTFLVYTWLVWARLMQSLIGMVVFVYFWRAVYANSSSLAGLTLDATLSYILLARIFQPLNNIDIITEFGSQLREGGLVQLLVRPLDIQLAYYGQGLATLLVELGRQLPVMLVALLLFRLRWPTDLAVWAVFLVSALLGRSILFCLNYSLACVAFYTTEAWELHWLVQNLTMFLGGALVPLAMLPGGLRLIVLSLPFAQGIYVPISLLSGLTPLSEAPRLLLIQLAWLAGLAAVSRLVFTVAIRRVTIQGG